MTDLDRNRYVTLDSIPGFLDRGFDRYSAGRVIARVTFLDLLLGEELPTLYDRLTSQAGLLPYLDAWRSGRRRCLSHNRQGDGWEVMTAEVDFDRAMAPAWALILRGVADFMAGLRLETESLNISLANSEWLRVRVEGLFGFWLLGQIRNLPMIVTADPAYAPTPRQLPEFNFNPGGPVTAEEFRRRFDREAAVYKRKVSTFFPSRRRGPRDAEVYQKYAAWFYRAMVKKEAIKAIASTEDGGDGRADDRRSEVKYGIRRAGAMLK